MKNRSNNQSIKKVITPLVIASTVFLSVFTFSNTKASAEINKIDYLADNECTLVIDKAQNVVKTNKVQKSTGVCTKYVGGIYFKKGSREFVSLDGWSINYIKYSGEPFYFPFGPTDAIMRVFITNSKENIKGKTMHVAALKLNVYKSANSKSKKLTYIKQYKTVKVKSVSGAWAKVTVNGKTGWVARKYLVNEVTVAEVEKVVTKYKTYTRIDPTLEPGEKILGEKGDNGLQYVYYKTKYKNGKLVSKKKKVWTDVVKETQDRYYFVGE